MDSIMRLLSCQQLRAKERESLGLRALVVIVLYWIMEKKMETTI